MATQVEQASGATISPRRYGVSEITQDAFAVLIAVAFVGALLLNWRTVVIAAAVLVAWSVAVSLLAVGLGQAASRPYPERDR